MANLISLGRLIDSSFDLYKKYWKEFFGISLWLVVASIPRLIGHLLGPLGAGPSVTIGDWISLAFSLIGSLILAVGTIWVIVSLISLADIRAKGKSPDFKAINRQSWKLIIPYVIVSVLALGIIVGASLLVAPGLILLSVSGFQSNLPAGLTALGALLLFTGGIAAFVLLIKFSLELGLAQYALVVDDKRGVQAIRTCFALIKDRWWATFVRYIPPQVFYVLVVALVNMLVTAVIALLITLLGHDSSILTKIGNVVLYFFRMVLIAVTMPLLVVANYTLYDSLRNSK